MTHRGTFMSGLMILTASVFEASCSANKQTDRQAGRQTDRQTNAGANPNPATFVGVSNYNLNLSRKRCLNTFSRI